MAMRRRMELDAIYLIVYHMRKFHKKMAIKRKKAADKKAKSAKKKGKGNARSNSRAMPSPLGQQPKETATPANTGSAAKNTNSAQK